MHMVRVVIEYCGAGVEDFLGQNSDVSKFLRGVFLLVLSRLFRRDRMHRIYEFLAL